MIRRDRERARARCAVLLVAVASVGCHTYVPVENPAPGTTARLHIPLRSGDPGSGFTETHTVEGKVISAGDSVVVESTSLVLLGAYREVTRIDTFRVARSALDGVEEERFSKPRTVALTAVIVGGSGFLAASALGLTGGQGGEDEKGGGDPMTPQIDVTPLIRTLVRLAGG